MRPPLASPASALRRPDANDDENASPAAAYCRDSDWGSPPPFPVREAPNDSRRVLSPSQGGNSLTPPPLPRRDGSEQVGADSPVGMRPDWKKLTQPPSAAKSTASGVQATPLPRRRGSRTPVGMSTGRRTAAGVAAGDDDETDYGVATEDWEAFYAGQQATPFSPKDRHASSAAKPQRGAAAASATPQPAHEDPASPKPRTLADVPELPPNIEYDDFGMPVDRNDAPRAVGEATPLAASRLIGVRPSNMSSASRRLALDGANTSRVNASSTIDASHATDGTHSRRRLAATLHFASPRPNAIDSVLDRIAATDDGVPAAFPDGTPGSTDVDYSPERSAVVRHAAVPMEEFSPERAPPSPPRGHRSRARLVAIGGAIGLTLSAAALIGLGAAGLLG